MNDPWPFSWAQVAWILALICGVTPLWASTHLPLVDLPQHLHLISVLHRLDDASTLYPEVFARRPVLTPYLGYYYAVSLLSWLMPLELANRIFLSAYVAGLPLSLAFLLASLKRPTWPALLAIPFAYGDSLAWGFINYCAALPLAFLTCGLFVRAIEDAARRRAWAIGLAGSLSLVLLFHVQVFAWLGVGLPLLLLTTAAPEGKSWRARVPALVGVVPGVVLFVLWIGLRVGQPQEIAPGQPWKSWGPMLSEQNLGWKTFDQNRAELVGVLGNMLPDGSDQRAVVLVLGAAALIAFVWVLLAGSRLVRQLVIVTAALGAYWFVPQSTLRTLGLVAVLVGGLAWLALRGRMAERIMWGAALCATIAVEWLASRVRVELTPAHRLFVVHAVTMIALWLAGRWELPEVRAEIAATIGAWRIVGLAALAVLLFFALPFDIRGYMYYLNTRYAHLAAAVAVCCVPAIPEVWSKRLVWVGAVAALVTAVPLAKGFSAFDDEAKALDELARSASDKPKVMGLIFATGSRASTHPVFLHASTVVARLRGGLTNFSFALTPHSPVMYRGEPPPTFASEWRPDQLNWETQGRFYDHFVLRGVQPAQIFGARMQSELYVAAQAGDFFLVRKR